MKNEQQERYDEIAKNIESYVDHNFKVPEGFIIPWGTSVIFKKEGNQEALTTDGGLIIPDIVAQNTNMPNIGRIYAVGPETNPILRPGLSVYVNQYANLELMFKGQIYMMVDQREVYGILPPKTFVSIDAKSDVEVGREKRIKRQEDFHDKKAIIDLNNLDKLEQKIKKGKK